MYGTSPKFLAALKGSMPNDHKKLPVLAALQCVSSAGSPLSHEIYNWFRATFPLRVPLVSGSGGTDLCAGS